MPVAAAKQALTSHIDGLRKTGLWLDGRSGLIAAVSGGPDSLALALLAADVCKTVSVGFEAVVVDHGLRPESAAEASLVVSRLTDRGITARCACVPGPAPSTGKQAWAREQRLQILCAHARQTASAVLFAHHGEDQAETVMMRLLRGSGIAGLAGMAPYSLYQGVMFARPFLGLTKADLVAVCHAYEAGFVTDPSNANPVFERVRTRQWLQQPGQQEARQQLRRLSAASSQLSLKVREAVQTWFAEHAGLTYRLRAEIDRAAFSHVGREQQRQILRHGLAVVGCQPYPPSADTVDQLLDRTAEGQASTAAGCVLQVTGQHLRLLAEFGRPPEPELEVTAGQLYCFDRRWLVYAPKDGVIRRLGPSGWAGRDHQHPAYREAENWPARMGMMLPCLHGLDGQPYHPHFKSYEAVCSAAGHAATDEGPSHRAEFAICSLAEDGALTLADRAPTTDKEGGRA